eukprot:3823269-Pyramimonas_sp.AAC.1
MCKHLYDPLRREREPNLSAPKWLTELRQLMGAAAPPPPMPAADWDPSLGVAVRVGTGESKSFREFSAKGGDFDPVEVVWADGSASSLSTLT